MKYIPRSRLVAGSVAVAGLAIGAVVAAPAASASSVTFAYDANGQSIIQSINSTVTLGPAVLTATVDGATGNITGTLPLPPVQTKYNALGVIPIQATVTFIPSGPVTGRIYNAPNNPRVQKVKSTAKYYLNLSNVTAAGLPLGVGNTCQTIDPVVINTKTPGKFNLTKGGTLTGVYSIGDFQNCGLLNTPLINSMVPGDGNTVTLVLSNGRFVPPGS